MKINFSVIAVSLLMFVSACKKEDKPAVETPEVTTGVYVLNEGNFGANNTTLTYYSFSTNTPVTDYYQNANGSGLGDTGNDMLIYGGKAYIVMNVSSYVEVTDAFTAKNIKKIPIETTAGVKRQPRYAAAYKSKVLVTSYDGTVAVIDTTSLEVEKWIEVGTNPEGLVVSGDRLYVANSGGLSAEFDSTLSVVDLKTFEELEKVVVGINPGAIAADNSGNIYVACAGNYADVAPSLVKLNTSGNTIVAKADTTVGKIKFYNGLLYTTGGYSGSPYVRTLNTTDFSQTGANFVTDGTTVTLPYGISIDEENGDVYVTDAKNFTNTGEVFCFDKIGKKKFSFSVSPGVSPNTVAIIRQ